MFANRSSRALLTVLLLMASVSAARAGGGYFALGYGPTARQMAGATTAYTQDAFAGASNPAKWLAAGNRIDIGAELFMPYRRVARDGSNTIYDFATTSGRDVFVIPEGAISRRVNDSLAWGVTLYGNGGLNTTYRGDNGVPGSNAAPTQCGARPANFLLGCGKLGFDLMQLVIAPGVAYQIAPGHSVGVAPLLALQRFKAYGLQSFANFSQHPGDVSNRGYDWALGLGIRVGWVGEITPWLSLGAAYASRVFTQEFEQYDGLLADGGLDIPENFSLGMALKPATRLVFTFDYQRINFGAVPAVANGVLNTLVNPRDNALGTRRGSGFNWRDQDNFHFGVEYAITPTLRLRGGYAYGERPQRDNSIDSVTFNMMTPNAIHQVSTGLTWQLRVGHELHLSYSRFVAPTYGGPSATALLGIGGTERVKAHVNTAMLGWSWKN